jgi:hypothetical protein
VFPASRFNPAAASVFVASLCAVAVLVGPLTAAAKTNECARPAPGVSTLSCDPIAADDRWRDEVVHVDGPFVVPAGVEIEGNAAEVSNPNGLLRKGGAVTTLTTTGEHSASVIILIWAAWLWARPR